MKWIWQKYHDLDDLQLRDVSELSKSLFDADQEDPIKEEYDEMSFHPVSYTHLTVRTKA